MHHVPAPVRPAYPRAEPPARTKPKRDPAPSRLAYRLNRLWLTPLFRKLTRVGLPAFAIAMIAGIWLSDENRRASLSAGFTSIIEDIQQRDEFMVKIMKIEGASPVVDAGLRAMLPVKLPASSFDIDLAALRERALKLDAVEAIDLRVKPGGVLSVVVTERVPAILWRHARGIEILDKTGHRVASVTDRDVRKDLPVIAGEGADKYAPEALALIAAAGPILPRLRGLVRVGERRWDMVLDKGQRILLPAEHPQRAVEYALELNSRLDMLGRDIVVVDLRDKTRPTVRMGIDAQNSIRQVRGQPLLGPDGEVLEQDPAAKPKGKGGAAGTKQKQASAPKSAKTGTN
ncbi:cell division protein FtsQ/DivIB [Paracoccus pacificus]|uniref:Cell division protein FtsQ n=1 Tax=Paracoccus pacificus TaxID=1463598 RepID=A0ABW4RA24_9RHOB